MPCSVAQRRNNRFWQRWLEQHRRRLGIVASTGSQKILIVVIVIVTLLAGMIPLLVSMPSGLAPLLLAGLPLLSLVLGYRYLVARFTRNFLALFPNALDRDRAGSAGRGAGHTRRLQCQRGVSRAGPYRIQADVRRPYRTYPTP